MMINFFERSEIQQDISQIDALLASGIFRSEMAGSLFFKSAFIEMLICLRNLMSKTKKYATPVALTDDVVLVPNQISDVTSLITYVRNALCHPESKAHFVGEQTKATFNVVFGKAAGLKLNELEQRSEYDDDVRFFFGPHGIYLQRHIVRALQEAKDKLLPIIERDHAAQIATYIAQRASISN